jgi:hypothetical protein
MFSKTRLILSGLAAVAAIAVPNAASASVHHSHLFSLSSSDVASTQISNRPDSGGNGNWANDAMMRTLTIVPGTDNNYTATVKDTGGTFNTVIGDFVPNQSANTGLKFSQSLAGTFSGGASYSFTANETPNMSLVPTSATGSGPTDTSDWYKLAFPAGTTFGGIGILNNWGWSYSTTETCLVPFVMFQQETQTWTDFASNNGGQGPGTPAAGQIKDFPAGCAAFG